MAQTRINHTERIKKSSIIILAAILGEIALILLTTVAQEVMFDGIDFYTSPMPDIVFGGLATFIAAVLAGMVAAFPVKAASWVPQLIISIIIVLETAYLMASGALSGPVWFDLLASASLIIGVWAGHYASKGFIYNS